MAASVSFVIAVQTLMVAPLYGLLGVMLFRQGKLIVSKQDTDENNEDIKELSRSVAEIHYEVRSLNERVDGLVEDHETIHHNTADENHCGAENCRFCDED